MRVHTLALLAVAAVVASVFTTIERGPGFHRYADTRTWLGIPNAGDVLSNAGFLVAAAWAMTRVTLPYGRALAAGVACIAVGSGAYHAAPDDVLLAFDWAPIVVTLAILVAAVLRDRDRERGAIVVGPALAIASVAWWCAGGGTRGGNMAPYVAVQAAGVAVPAIAVLLARGAICARWILAGTIGFGLARLFGAYDRELLDAIGISGHSLKHLAAAGAAACALRALMRA